MQSGRYVSLDVLRGLTVTLMIVVNTPGNIASDVRHARDTLKDLARRPLRLEKEQRLESIRRRDEEHQETLLYRHDWLASGAIPGTPSDIR